MRCCAEQECRLPKDKIKTELFFDLHDCAARVQEDTQAIVLYAVTSPECNFRCLPGYYRLGTTADTDGGNKIPFTCGSDDNRQSEKGKQNIHLEGAEANVAAFKCKSA